jgi:site-specific recombinase XerD
MANIKYLEEHISKKGVVTWGANPSKPLREKLFLTYESFNNKKEATQRCLDFEKQYRDYKRGIDKQIHITESSVAGLITAFYQTSNWSRLSVNSKNTYRQLLTYICNCRVGNSNITFGETFHQNITAETAELLHAQMCKDVSEHRAVHVCKVLRRVWFVGFRLGRTRSNPFSKMGLVTLPSRDVRWKEEHIDAFVKKADEMNVSSIGTLALLCYHLCQRVGDMRQLTWNNYENGTFTFVQEKSRTVKKPKGNLMILDTNEFIDTRLHNLKRGNGSDFIIINERTGRPYTKWAYKAVAEVRKAAGLPEELKISDLRRTGATEAGEAGCTEDEIMALTGHTSRDVVNVYVKKTSIMATNASNKRLQRYRK